MKTLALEQPLPDLRTLIASLVQSDEIVFTDHDRPRAKLVAVDEPAELPEGKPQFGCLKGLIEMRDDFDEPLECFREYMP